MRFHFNPARSPKLVAYITRTFSSMPSTTTTASNSSSSSSPFFRRFSTLPRTRCASTNPNMPPSLVASSSCCPCAAPDQSHTRLALRCYTSAASASAAAAAPVQEAAQQRSHVSGFLADYSLPLHPPSPDPDDIWAALRRDAEEDAESEPILAPFYRASVLSHSSLESSLASLLASKLASTPAGIPPDTLTGVFLSAFSADPSTLNAIRADLRAARDRDPACLRMVHCFLYYKGFHALTTHRAAHALWRSDRRALALFLQSRSSEIFSVDIHPGAQIGSGILLDHATGVVIGETAVVGNDVSLLHGVTLGGTGKEVGDRHPKIGDGVLVGAGTQILGCVKVGEGAKVGAGSVVLKDVPARTTAVGNPARLIGGKENPVKLDKVPSFTMDHTSWSDYVI